MSKTATKTETPGQIVHDSDLKAMNAIAKAMRDLTDADKVVVRDWFVRRFVTQPQEPAK